MPSVVQGPESPPDVVPPPDGLGGAEPAAVEAAAGAELATADGLASGVEMGVAITELELAVAVVGLLPEPEPEPEPLGLEPAAVEVAAADDPALPEPEPEPELVELPPEPPDGLSEAPLGTQPVCVTGT